MRSRLLPSVSSWWPTAASSSRHSTSKSIPIATSQISTAPNGCCASLCSAPVLLGRSRLVTERELERQPGDDEVHDPVDHEPEPDAPVEPRVVVGPSPHRRGGLRLMSPMRGTIPTRGDRDRISERSASAVSMARWKVG